MFEVWIANHLAPALLNRGPKAADIIAPEASSISAIVGFLETPDASLAPSGA